MDGFSKSELAAWDNYRRSYGEAVSELAVPNDFWSFGDYELVGHGEVTDKDKCGKFLGFYGCIHTELHNKSTLDGLNCKDMVYVRKVRNFCDKPSCPVCYRHGWAVREASNIESRIKEAAKKFGQAEHIIVSVPEADYGLTLDSLRKKVVEVLAARGVFGGCLIFHAFRYHRRDESFVGEAPRWYWSPHFHCIGFIDGGYSRCRHCTKNTKLGGVYCLLFRCSALPTMYLLFCLRFLLPQRGRRLAWV